MTQELRSKMNLRKALIEQNNIFDEIPNDVLFKYIESRVNLEIAKEMAIQNMDNLQQKRTQLVEEKKKLNDLHQRVFSMNNEFCDSAWKFSNKYDFPGIIQYYVKGRMTKCEIQPHRDEFTRCEREFQKLSKEIADILKELTRLSDTNYRMNVKQESDIDVQLSTSKFATQDVSKVPNNTQSSKFVLKTPTAFSRLYKKR